MAQDSSKELRNTVFYEVFPRNHSAEGTLEGLRRDLPRIHSLGVDYLWLMPFFPIGDQRRKGRLGSPYAIQDYRSVDPALGTEQDLHRLLDDVHDLGMGAVLDVVYNHTAWDSVLFREHPEWFYRDQDGQVGNRFGDWYDVIDLDYTQPGLWEYQIDTLLFWADFGFDAFRCDVASFVPLEFWMEARRRVAAHHPDFVWLGESVQPPDILTMRRDGFPVCSDGELFQAFDLLYEYDTYYYWRKLLEGSINVDLYLHTLTAQEYQYPDNYCKLRFVENHDFPRAAGLLGTGNSLRAWTACKFFHRGAMLLYAGQELAAPRLPDLFERDIVDWSRDDDGFTDFLRRLMRLKKHPLLRNGELEVVSGSPCLVLRYQRGRDRVTGIFNTEAAGGRIQTGLRDGHYQDLLGSGTLQVTDGGHCAVPESAVVIEG